MEEFIWERHPKAEKIAESLLTDAVDQNKTLSKLEEDLRSGTSSRLFDWVDHFIVPSTNIPKTSLEEVGYVLDGEFEAGVSYRHPGAQLPQIVLSQDSENGVAVKVDSIANFLMTRGLQRMIEGSILSGFRKCLVTKEEGVSFWAVERRSSRTMDPIYAIPEHVQNYLECKEHWKTRPRQSLDEEREFQYAIELAKHFVSVLGKDMAAWVVMEVEREYWQARNIAGQVQKARQDKLGMGWANHDHHTFRCSRHSFIRLVSLFKVLGFYCRERFYAGEEAGWGAQVMENDKAGLILFLDVDLEPEEVMIDFAHTPLSDSEKLGTIGLWCGLHGDSILKSGMHHLEGQFNFDDMKEDLKQLGVEMMAPFSDFSFLRQAFTKGETWPVSSDRLDLLFAHGWITEQEKGKFKAEGAIGSHLENLQRREGYKGFNQKNVSKIIKKTDPRKTSN